MISDGSDKTGVEVIQMTILRLKRFMIKKNLRYIAISESEF